MEDDFRLETSTIGIIGLGLMGGSLALSLKGKCAHMVGYDTHPPTLELALSNRIIDRALAPLPSPFQGEGQGMRVDVLILATPVPFILDLIHQLSTSANYQSPITILDIGSTKREITQAMSFLPANFNPMGGHPICGKEKLGLENADPNLYQNAPFIITPLERTPQYAIRSIQAIISAIGANCIEMTADEHDRVFASTSHFPFLLSSALAHSTSQTFAPFIGPGFRSTSRLAGTPSHMMMGILKSNRDNVLNAIQTFRTSLDQLESALKNEEYNELENVLNQSRSRYHSIVDG